jgi:hypothetical protein
VSDNDWLSDAKGTGEMTTTRQAEARNTARAVMLAAWAAYRSAAFPSDDFNRARFGRFGRLLRACWSDVRKPIVPPTTRRGVIEREIALLACRADYRAAQVRRAELVAELATLAA